MACLDGLCGTMTRNQPMFSGATNHRCSSFSGAQINLSCHFSKRISPLCKSITCNLHSPASVSTTSTSILTAKSLPPVQFENENKSTGLSSEKFDEWMQRSVVEIVKNLGDSPLFVHIYNGGQQLKTEKVTGGAENWAQMEGKWKTGEEAAPEGIILVEELKDQDDKLDLDGRQNGTSESTKAWGVLLLGRGASSFSSACYLLKTDRVRAGANLGFFSTHFCLTKVSSFRESIGSQFKYCWLV